MTGLGGLGGLGGNSPLNLGPWPEPAARRGSRWSGAGRLLLALALGAAHTVALVHTGWWWLSLLSMAALALMWRSGSPGRSAGLGFAFSLGWLLAAVWWLFISMHRYGALPAPLAAMALLALCAALSLVPAFWLGLAASRRGGRAVPDALRFAAAWLAMEVARGQWFTGFPWAATGYGQVDGPLAGYAPWLGVYGIGAVAAFSAAMLGFWLLPRTGAQADAPRRTFGATPGLWHRWSRAAPLALLLALWLVPLQLAEQVFTRPAGTLSVALLQPNVPQDEKFTRRHVLRTLDWLDHQLREPVRADGGPALVVAPETALPLLPGQLAELSPGWFEGLERHFARPGAAAAMLGLPLGDERQGYTNSVAGLGSGPMYRYDKHHLVPFGEFIPTGFRWFTELMQIPLGDFNRGPRVPAVFAAAGQRLAPNVCYEDLFGEELAQRFSGPEDGHPTVLVNLSNIAWFGPTIAVAQHLGISRMRSLELQRPMLRATNTGATAAIDHHGRVLAMQPPFSQGVLRAEVQGRSGLTPFARWAGTLGLWPLWALALAVLAWPVRPSARR